MNYSRSKVKSRQASKPASKAYVVFPSPNPKPAGHVTYHVIIQEYHLQAALQGAGVAVDNEIPVPPPQKSSLNYNDFYTLPNHETATYIRFSQTVEECIGCLYDMTEEDDEFLQSYNQKRAVAGQLLEDDFERMMEVFEETAYIKAPFASIDQTVVPYDEMVQGLTDLDSPKLMVYAKDVYEYWKTRRQDPKQPATASDSQV